MKKLALLILVIGFAAAASAQDQKTDELTTECINESTDTLSQNQPKKHKNKPAMCQPSKSKQDATDNNPYSFALKKAIRNSKKEPELISR